MRPLRVVFGALIAGFVVPMLFLGVCEVSLRLFGYGHSTDVFKREVIDGKTCYVTNPKFYQQFFGLPVEGLVNWDEFEVQVPEEKPKGGIRVFVLGSSTVSGLPPDPAFGVWRNLRVLLKRQYPDLSVEVYNMGFPALNSHCLVHLADACVRLKPDYVVIYMGDNEAIGPFARQTTVRGTQGGLLGVKWKLWFGKFRLWQFASSLNEGMSASSGLPFVPQDMFLRINPDSAEWKQICRQFSANLEDACSAITDSGTKGILCTVGCNIQDWGPFISSNSKSIPSGALTELTSLLSQSNEKPVVERERLLQQALAIDPGYAMTRYLLGKTLLECGKLDEAKNEFRAALERDFCPVRAKQKINEAIRAVATQYAERGILLGDTQSALDNANSNGCAGASEYYDCVHLTPRGSAIVSREIFRAMLGKAPEISEETLAESLGLCDASQLDGIRTMLGILPVYPKVCGWEITGQKLEAKIKVLESRLAGGEVKDRIEGWDKAVGLDSTDLMARMRLVTCLKSQGEQEVFEKACKDAMGTFRGHRFFRRAAAEVSVKNGDKREAVRQLLQLLSEKPEDWATRYEYGNVLRSMNEFKSAVDEYRRVILDNPAHDAAMLALAEVLAGTGQENEAIAHCESSLRFNPRSIAAYECLVRLTKDKEDTLRVFLEELRTCYPGVATIHHYLGRTHETIGNASEAAAAYTKAASLDPKYQEDIQHISRMSLLESAKTFVDEEKWVEAEAAWRELYLAEPSNRGHLAILADVLMKLGRNKDAHKLYFEAIKLNPDHYELYQGANILLAEDEKEEFWRSIIAERPDSRRALMLLGDSLSRTGRSKEAAEAYLEASRLDPKDPAAFAMLANARLQAGDGSGAKTAAERAVELNPASAWAHELKALACETLSEWDDAIASARRAETISPENEAVKTLLLRLQKQAGQKK